MALEEVLGRGNRTITALTVRILDWGLGEQRRETPGDAEGRRQHELASLQRLLAQEVARGTPDSVVARAARDLIAERSGVPVAADVELAD